MSIVAKKQAGFTIVELLIVIVVIAILATVSVVAYGGVQDRAGNAAVQSDLKNIATKIELYKAAQGAYPAPTTAIFSTLELKATKAAYEITQGIHAVLVHNLLYCRTPDSTKFALIARSKSGDAFQYSNGSVGRYSGPLQSGATEAICASGGAAIATGSDFIWFYRQNAWQSWVGG